jgi:hypothetical protein
MRVADLVELATLVDRPKRGARDAPRKRQVNCAA